MAEVQSRIPIPEWAVPVSLALCVERSSNFQNQFTTSKLKSSVADDPILAAHVEGVIGYIGDICACILLGIDPAEMLRNMLLATHMLTKRDEYDLEFNGWRIDVKTELVPRHLLHSIVERTIRPDMAYGCRLINQTQFEQNSTNVDAYLFGLLDAYDPRQAVYWWVVGVLEKAKATLLCPEPRLRLGTRALHTPAYVFPTDALDPETQATANSRSTANRLIDMDANERRRFDALCKRVGL